MLVGFMGLCAADGLRKRSRSSFPPSHRNDGQNPCAFPGLRFYIQASVYQVDAFLHAHEAQSAIAFRRLHIKASA